MPHEAVNTPEHGCLLHDGTWYSLDLPGLDELNRQVLGMVALSQNGHGGGGGEGRGGVRGGEGEGRGGGGGYMCVGGWWWWCGQDVMTMSLSIPPHEHAPNWCGNTPGSLTPGVPATKPSTTKNSSSSRAPKNHPAEPADS